jgi:hypothetical protein
VRLPPLLDPVGRCWEEGGPTVTARTLSEAPLPCGEGAHKYVYSLTKILRDKQKHKAESWKTCAPHGKVLVTPSRAVPGACIARNCQGPDPAAHFTASASGTQGLTYAVSQERFLRSTQQHSYRMCLDHCSRRPILPLHCQLQASAFSPRRVGCKLLDDGRSRGEMPAARARRVFLDLPKGGRALARRRKPARGRKTLPTRRSAPSGSRWP